MQYFSKYYVFKTVMCVPCRFQISFVLLKVLCGDNRTSYHKLWWARPADLIEHVCHRNVSTLHSSFIKQWQLQLSFLHILTKNTILIYVVVCKAKPDCTFVSPKCLHQSSAAFNKHQRQLLDLIIYEYYWNGLGNHDLFQ